MTIRNKIVNRVKVLSYEGFLKLLRFCSAHHFLYEEDISVETKNKRDRPKKAEPLINPRYTGVVSYTQNTVKSKKVISYKSRCKFLKDFVLCECSWTDRTVDVLVELDSFVVYLDYCTPIKVCRNKEGGYTRVVVPITAPVVYVGRDEKNVEMKNIVIDFNLLRYRMTCNATNADEDDEKEVFVLNRCITQALEKITDHLNGELAKLNHSYGGDEFDGELDIGQYMSYKLHHGYVCNYCGYPTIVDLVGNKEGTTHCVCGCQEEHDLRENEYQARRLELNSSLLAKRR